MRTFFFLFSFLLAIVACSKKKTADCPSIEKHYSFRENAKVDITHNQQFSFALIGSGNKLVFSYESNTIECPGIEDGGSSELLLFEADPASNSFTYNTPDMQSSNVYFRLSCGICSQAVQNAVTPASGTITGTRLTPGSWQIDFDITITDLGRRTGSGVFNRQ